LAKIKSKIGDYQTEEENIQKFEKALLLKEKLKETLILKAKF
jgi:hypothetical protein